MTLTKKSLYKLWTGPSHTRTTLRLTTDKLRTNLSAVTTGVQFRANMHLQGTHLHHTLGHPGTTHPDLERIWLTAGAPPPPAAETATPEGTSRLSSSENDQRHFRNPSGSRIPATVVPNRKPETKIPTLNTSRAGARIPTCRSFRKRKKDDTATGTTGNQCREPRPNGFRRKCTNGGETDQCYSTDRHSSTRRILTDRWHDWIRW